jgi:hypothetical protein
VVKDKTADLVVLRSCSVVVEKLKVEETKRKPRKRSVAPPSTSQEAVDDDPGVGDQQVEETGEDVVPESETPDDDEPGPSSPLFARARDSRPRTYVARHFKRRGILR